MGQPCPCKCISQDTNKLVAVSQPESGTARPHSPLLTSADCRQRSLHIAATLETANHSHTTLAYADVLALA